MTFEDFEKFQAALLSEVTAMGATKGKEYANGGDRFGNFDRLAARLKLSRETVCLVYLVKHLDGIESFVKNGRTFSEERIRGRIVDAIAYLTLLAGMIENPPK